MLKNPVPPHVPGPILAKHTIEELHVPIVEESNSVIRVKWSARKCPVPYLLRAKKNIFLKVKWTSSRKWEELHDIETLAKHMIYSG